MDEQYDKLIVVPPLRCIFCGEYEVYALQESMYGIPYAFRCKCGHCGACGDTHKSEQAALSQWAKIAVRS